MALGGGKIGRGGGKVEEESEGEESDEDGPHGYGKFLYQSLKYMKTNRQLFPLRFV